jgi:RNA-directed DNA polymerase
VARKGGANVIFEADVKSFFDKVHRRTMLEMLGERIADKSFMRLVGKCLNVGVLDGQVFTRPDEGTVQGSIISPMLGNIYLHNVLDKWFEEQVKPRLWGEATLIRYCDDFIICFERMLSRPFVLRMASPKPKRQESYLSFSSRCQLH